MGSQWMVRIPGSSGNTCSTEYELWRLTNLLISTGHDAVQIVVSVPGGSQTVLFRNGPVRLPAERRRLRPEHADAVDALMLTVGYHVDHHGDRYLIEECDRAMCTQAYTEFLRVTGGEQNAVTGQGQ